ncbi:23S rRNA (adenine(2503)-C(2))-methyltransferase RlmN [Candidatus Woesearchaeota archaeon]|nr:23S rRNA (adenine(2503)-C(2))-methyltransferase RlmN [Candidatus Woesearchaeota archaeon]
MRIAACVTALDGTEKFLIGLADGKKVESVLIRHKRTVCACLSSQVGCAMKCAFCATGLMGFQRNLSVEEIVGQFDLMESVGVKITNVVFMGMGEPLHNYDSVVGAVNLLRKKGLSWQKITVSTVGLPDGIRALGRDVQCRIAWSLHAPNDVLRSKLVPVNSRFPIQDVVMALLDFPARRKNEVMIEYVLLDGVNDSLEHAKELAVLLKQLPFVVVNLIPYNSVAGIEFRRPSQEKCVAFKQALIDAGFKTIVRTTKGLDADAACGMLSTRSLVQVAARD